jgi:mono/diheme cytochrome c family protein
MFGSPGFRLLCLVALSLSLIGCVRGCTSSRPPIHIVPNMDFQEKLKAQSESKFEGWKDRRGMRLPVRGTVARGSLGAFDPDPEIAKLHVYKNADGTFVTKNPVPKTLAVLERGQERYAIHCAVCHGLNGRGLGIVGRKLGNKPPNLVQAASDEDERVRQKPEIAAYTDGQLYDIITNGFSTMQPYRFQVSVEDRWAIIHYLRALQLRAKH